MVSFYDTRLLIGGSRHGEVVEESRAIISDLRLVMVNIPAMDDYSPAPIHELYLRIFLFSHKTSIAFWAHESLTRQLAIEKFVSFITEKANAALTAS